MIMQKLEKSDVERFLVPPVPGRGCGDPSAIRANCWDQGEEIEKEDFYWGQLDKAEALGFPIDGGNASVLVKTCGPSRAIGVLYFLFTALELLVKKGLGLPRAIFFIRSLIDEEKTVEKKEVIEGWFCSLGFLPLKESGLDIFFDSIVRGMRWALGYIQYHPKFYQEMFEKLGGRKLDDKKLAEKCNERTWLRFGWEKEWVYESEKKLALLFNSSLFFAEGLLYLLCTKAVNTLSKPCDFRLAKVQYQMLFAELGCPLNQYSVPRFMEMLHGILQEMDRRHELKTKVQLHGFN